MGHTGCVEGKKLVLGKKEPARGWRYSERRGNFASVVEEIGVDESVVAAILWDKPDCDIEWAIHLMYTPLPIPTGKNHKVNCECRFCQ